MYMYEYIYIYMCYVQRWNVRGLAKTSNYLYMYLSLSLSLYIYIHVPRCICFQRLKLNRAREGVEFLFTSTLNRFVILRSIYGLRRFVCSFLRIGGPEQYLSVIILGIPKHESLQGCWVVCHLDAECWTVSRRFRKIVGHELDWLRWRFIWASVMIPAISNCQVGFFSWVICHDDRVISYLRTS